MIKYVFVFFALIGNNPKEIAKINELKRDAERFFKQNNFQAAANKYIFLKDSMNIEDPEMMLNLAHCYYQLADSSNARTTYQNVAALGSDEAKSIAYQQLGVMAKKPESLEESLQLMKAAVKANPSNLDARYDYEVVKKLLEKQQQEQQNQQNNDDQQQQEEEKQNEEEQDQEQQENQEQQQDQEKDKGEQQQQEQQQEQEGEEGEEQEQQQEQEGEEGQEEQEQEATPKEKLEEMNISEEKARMILEAMRNNEIQYIQQQKRKATKRPESDKPDW